MDLRYSYKTQRCLDNIPVKGGCYIFRGDRGLGKCLAAQKLAGKVVNRTPDRLSSSPDYLYIAPNDGKIGVDDLGIVRRFVSYVPAEGDIKVCIIDDADTLTSAAQNALLKTLEDNTNKTLFILVAHDDLMPTIQSRSISVLFDTLDKQCMHELFPETQDIVLELADGHPGQVVRFEKETGLLEDIAWIQKTFQTMHRKRELFEVFHLVKEKDKDNFYDKYDSLSIRSCLKILLGIFQKALEGEATYITDVYSCDEILAVCSALQKAIYRLKMKGAFNRNDFFDLIRIMAA